MATTAPQGTNDVSGTINDGKAQIESEQAAMYVPPMKIVGEKIEV